MCRAVAYLGEPLTLDVLLYRSDSSLVRQAFEPAMFDFMNLAGSGLALWDGTPGPPLIYKTTTLPMYDRNLQALAAKVSGRCVIAHVRGCDYFGSSDPLVERSNLHPFQFPGSPLALAHNGDVSGFREMRPHLLKHVSRSFEQWIEGSTDSEWIYALVASRLEASGRETATAIADAMQETFDILRQVRRDLGITTAAPVNLFVSNGEHLVCSRHVLDFGRYDGTPRARHLRYQTLWFTAGSDYAERDGEWRMSGGLEDATSILVASEPLTRNVSSWIEIPEYHMLLASRKDGALRIQAREILS